METLTDYKNDLTTPESARNWTEKSPNSKLSEIYKIINNFLEQYAPQKKEKNLKEKVKDKVKNGIGKLLNISDTNSKNIKEIQTLKDKLNRGEYRDFQMIIGVPYNKCDGKLGSESLTYLNNYVDKYNQQNKIIQETRTDLSNLRQSVGIIKNTVDTVRIQESEDKYLSQYETMGEGEYNRLFSGKENLQQGQLGDCYLVSGIHELVRAQHFDTLMRTSIQHVRWKDGSGKGYQIKIPLGEPSGRKILIKDSELGVAKIIGNDGYKLLELAYAKNKLRKNDRQGNEYKPITSGELDKITGGCTKEVLQTFLGKNNIGFNDFYGLSNLGGKQKKEICSYLKHYNPSIGNKFVSLASLPGSSDRYSYNVGQKILYHNHAYSLTGVNKDSKGEIKSITVLNPWNDKGKGENYQNFTMDEFFSAFSIMSCGKIKTKEFLNHKSVS